MSEHIKITRIDKDNWFFMEDDSGNVIEKLGTDEALHAATCWAVKQPMPYGGWRSKEFVKRKAAEDLRRVLANWLEATKNGSPFPFGNVEEEWREFAKHITYKQID